MSYFGFNDLNALKGAVIRINGKDVKCNGITWNNCCSSSSSSVAYKETPKEESKKEYTFYDDAVLDYLLSDVIQQKTKEAMKAIHKEIKRTEHLRIDAINANIKNVIFNDPYTIILWKDGKKTIVKCQPGDVYDKEKGLALALVKHFMCDSNYFNTIFKKWLPEDSE